MKPLGEEKPLPSPFRFSIAWARANTAVNFEGRWRNPAPAHCHNTPKRDWIHLLRSGTHDLAHGGLGGDVEAEVFPAECSHGWVGLKSALESRRRDLLKPDSRAEKRCWKLRRPDSGLEKRCRRLGHRDSGAEKRFRRSGHPDYGAERRFRRFGCPDSSAEKRFRRLRRPDSRAESGQFVGFPAFAAG